MSDTIFEVTSRIAMGSKVSRAASSTGVVILVTGANRGIGLKIVHRMCEVLASSPKSTVMLSSRSLESATAAVQSIRSAMNHTAVPSEVNLVPRRLDISNQASISELVGAVESEFGRLDILINNAGIAYKMADSTPFPQQARSTIDVNYYGTKNTTIAFLPLLRRSVLDGGGRVVSVSSTSGQLKGSSVSEVIQCRFLSETATVSDLDKLVEEFVSLAQNGEHKGKGFSGSAYGTSKTAVTQLMRVLDKEEAQAVQFYSCCPGLCRTDMAGGEWKSFMSVIFWVATWIVGQSAYAGADTPVWLSMNDHSENISGKFIRNRVQQNY
mmetsp:Transcript_23962/g.35173  ORF Transcript_23962/g.35173 Transcript_23962/m.35173 type:complete len:325 (+) Transcript_23962:38-1012(+)